MSGSLDVTALPGIGEVAEGDDVGGLISAAAREAGFGIEDGHVVAISQKVVSKAEGRVRSLAGVRPGPRAIELAAALGKDPRLVELVLGESRRVVRAERGVLVVETRGGWVCANAGVDSSNVPGAETVALLPADADASARRIRAALARSCGRRPAVLITDSFGRPWRHGQAEVAIGCAGLVAVDDWRGRADSEGAELRATAIAIADQLAAAADLARDKASRSPVAVIAGAGRWRTEDDGPGAAASLQRAAGEDLFR